MVKNTPTNYHALTLDELQHLVSELETGVQEARLQLAAGKLDKPSQVWQQAEKLAQVKTVLREKQLQDEA